jgi:hypothetical protein
VLIAPPTTGAVGGADFKAAAILLKRLPNHEFKKIDANATKDGIV